MGEGGRVVGEEEREVATREKGNGRDRGREGQRKGGREGGRYG